MVSHEIGWLSQSFGEHLMKFDGALVVGDEMWWFLAKFGENWNGVGDKWSKIGQTLGNVQEFR